ncbi:MAG: metallophosphoesterase [Clostridioides sp.]|jgi:putative phosphoesterase|nr:metallophosphoesterase [Clostridioides sp.]
MRKLAVVSDTHRVELIMDKFIDRIKDCDLILHAGDNFEDCTYIQQLTGKEVIGVPGNCDHKYVGIAERELVLEVDGVNILLCHGDQYNVQFDTYTLESHAELAGVDVAIFGHTHRPYKTEYNGILYINPGSLSIPRGGTDSGFMILNIENGNFDVEYIVI